MNPIKSDFTGVDNSNPHTQFPRKGEKLDKFILEGEYFKFANHVPEKAKKYQLRDFYEKVKAKKVNITDNGVIIATENAFNKLAKHQYKGPIGWIKRKLHSLYNGVVRREGFHDNEYFAKQLISDLKRKKSNRSETAAQAGASKVLRTPSSTAPTQPGSSSNPFRQGPPAPPARSQQARTAKTQWGKTTSPSDKTYTTSETPRQQLLNEVTEFSLPRAENAIRSTFTNLLDSIGGQMEKEGEMYVITPDKKTARYGGWDFNLDRKITLTRTGNTVKITGISKAGFKLNALEFREDGIWATVDLLGQRQIAKFS